MCRRKMACVLDVELQGHHVNLLGSHRPLMGRQTGDGGGTAVLGQPLQTHVLRLPPSTSCLVQVMFEVPE